jgi:hypothetical protein
MSRGAVGMVTSPVNGPPAEAAGGSAGCTWTVARPAWAAHGSWVAFAGAQVVNERDLGGAGETLTRG